MWQGSHSSAWRVAGSDRQAVDYSRVKHQQHRAARVALCSLFELWKTVGLFRGVAIIMLL